MFSYEWIVMIITTVAIVLIWELCYSFFSVKLTAGQRYRVFYDYNISGYQSQAFLDILDSKDTFSYDVLELKFEQVLKESTVLSNRYELGVTDAIVTDIHNQNKDDTTKNPHYRAAEIIDQFEVYSYERLVLEAKEYVDSYMTNGEIDSEKLESNFRLRMKGDNRFRTEDQIKEGLVLERNRIEKLLSDIKTVEKLFEYDNERVLDGKESIFYSYKKYSQSLSEARNDDYKQYYENLIKDQTEENYGLKLWLLTGGAKNTANYFNLILTGKVSCEDVVMMIFDIKSHQPELQFESVSMLATLVREFSSIAG